jgi:hypothetical protein
LYVGLAAIGLQAKNASGVDKVGFVNPGYYNFIVDLHKQFAEVLLGFTEEFRFIHWRYGFTPKI